MAGGEEEGHMCKMVTRSLLGMCLDQCRQKLLPLNKDGLVSRKKKKIIHKMKITFVCAIRRFLIIILITVIITIFPCHCPHHFNCDHIEVSAALQEQNNVGK